MTFCEIVEFVFILLLILAIAYGWWWCMRNPESCKYWGPERRQADQPLDFPCRRKKQGHENA